MQLSQIQFRNKPTRYYIDAKHVDVDTYYSIIKSEEMKGNHQNSFLTRSTNILGKYIHTSQI